MSNISGKYAIVGAAETKVGKRPEASTHSLHLECIKACLVSHGQEKNCCVFKIISWKNFACGCSNR